MVKKFSSGRDAMTTMIDTSQESTLSPLEKHDELNKLTDRFLSGEMEAEEYLEKSRRFNLDFEAFISELAAKRIEAEHPRRNIAGPVRTPGRNASKPNVRRARSTTEGPSRLILAALGKVLGNKI